MGKRTVREGRVLDVLLAAYQETVDGDVWVTSVMGALRGLFTAGRTATWFEYRSHHESDGLHLDATLHPQVLGDDCELATWTRARESLPPSMLTKLFGRTAVGTASVTGGAGAQTSTNPAWRKMWREPVVDSFGMVTCDTDGSGVCVSVGLDRLTALSAREKALLE
ncbi:MAG: hypothetical protein ABI551_11355, partial [Polyangiaceae bacterium]